ncbi:hypothetical protein F5144DRAFT_582779 [Chaetomium tenue]|uniref:Uncharacterized protein n=1 Tax=Chaetomium tenue TaxID=1854479 RepID=A0ACB7NXT9_9PEZI|nr:hypothetical protein F5144DRAFT_582779 [Chaetomium globosum]
MVWFAMRRSFFRACAAAQQPPRTVSGIITADDVSGKRNNGDESRPTPTVLAFVRRTGNAYPATTVATTFLEPDTLTLSGPFHNEKKKKKKRK